MNSNTKNIAIFLVVIAGLYGVYSVMNKLNIDFSSSNVAPTKPTPVFTVKSLLYTNTSYNFSYEYPNTLSLKEIGADKQVLGRQATLQFSPLVEISLIKGGAEITLQSFEEFVLDQARSECSTVNETVSITCTRIDDVVNIKPFTSTNGVQGQVFYLKAQQKNLSSGKVDSVRRGPFYTFNSSSKTVGVMSFIMIGNPTSVTAEAADKATIESVARSLSLK